MVTNLLVLYLMLVATLTLADQRLTLVQRAVVKMLAASLFLYLPLMNQDALGHFEWWIFAGLAASWLGDLCLVWPGTGKRFKLGIAAFLMAHVAYATAFVFVEVDPHVAGVLIAIFLGVGFAVYSRLKPNIALPLRIPVQLYILALCLMTALAWSISPPYNTLAFGLGASAFLVSDISVALQRFGSNAAVHRLWGIPLYFAAQMCFSILISGCFL